MERKHNTGLRSVPFYPGAAGILAPDGVVIGHALGSTRSEHNAQMWAAAPDLLEALESLIDYVEAHADHEAEMGNDVKYIMDAVRRGQAALSKASGGGQP